MFTRVRFESWPSCCQSYDLRTGPRFKCCLAKFLKKSKGETCLPGRDITVCTTSSHTPQKLLHLAGDTGGQCCPGESGPDSRPHREVGEVASGGGLHPGRIQLPPALSFEQALSFRPGWASSGSWSLQS